MLFGKKVNKLRGVELINEVSDRFKTMIDDLDQGVADCRDEQSSIKATVEQLNERSDSLDKSAWQAAHVATNLRTLLGG